MKCFLTRKKRLQKFSAISQLLMIVKTILLSSETFRRRANLKPIGFQLNRNAFSEITVSNETLLFQTRFCKYSETYRSEVYH